MPAKLTGSVCALWLRPKAALGDCPRFHPVSPVTVPGFTSKSILPRTRPDRKKEMVTVTVKLNDTAATRRGFLPLRKATLFGTTPRRNAAALYHCEKRPSSESGVTIRFFIDAG